MKSKRRTRVAYGLILLMCGLFLFFFYTPVGLLSQASLALKIQPLYLRFLSARVAATGGVYCKDGVARQLYMSGMNNLWAAHEAVSAAIAQRPYPMGFRRRAYIEMGTGSYSNAVADFEQALSLWQHEQYDFDFNPTGTSNSLEIAQACAAAKNKYWLDRNNRPENPSTPPDFEPKQTQPSP